MTNFAPTGRYSAAELDQQQQLVESCSLLQAMIDAMPSVVTILNDRRQVVAANRTMLNLLSADLRELIGLRTGEILGCAHCSEGPDGCGTGPHCVTCGGVRAVLGGVAGESRVIEECRLSLDPHKGAGALDLRATATAVDVEGQRFVVCVIEDISDEKRLGVLTRMFFHDVLNTAGCIRGYTNLLADHPEILKDGQTLERLGRLSNQLIDELESHRDLSFAESGDLDVRPELVDAQAVVDNLISIYGSHPAANGRCLVRGVVWPGRLSTDLRLLSRVLANMIKNALEATPPGGEVTVNCRRQGIEVLFSVHNVGTIPAEVQLQIFQRSFSTKEATGRGIGTHSMKLLGERYLGGHVEFTSREPEGTTFTLRVPLILALRHET